MVALAVFEPPSAANSSPVTTVYQTPPSTARSTRTKLQSTYSRLANPRLIGVWRLDRVSGPTSKVLQSNLKNGYAAFDVVGERIAVSLTHGRNGCAETGGLLSEKRGQIKLTTIFDKAAIACFTRVPAIEKLGATLLVGDRINIAGNRLSFDSPQSHLEFTFSRLH